MEYEIGYTPNNLKKILKESGKKREDLADFCGVTLKSVHNWCISIDRANHQDMPLKHWLNFLDLVGVGRV